MSAEIRSRECVSLRDAQPADLPAVLALLGRARLPTAGFADALPHFVIAEDDYFPRFGFSCVSRESVVQEVQGSIEFQEACPASAVVMRKSLRESTR
jgi:hypothetical protein